MTEYGAYGTALQIGDGGATEAFTTVAQVRRISGPSLSMETIDVTAHDSPGAYREMVASFLDPGEVTFDIVFDPAGATHDPSTGLLATYEARTNRNWKLVFSDTATTTWEFAGYITAFSPDAPVDGALTASVTIRVNGQPTLA